MAGDPNERGFGTGAAMGVDYGGHDRPDPPATSSRSRSPAAGLGKARTRGGMRLAITGVKELDRELEAIAADEGPKSLNAAMRRFCRDAVKTIVLPKVRELIPYDDGRGANKSDGKEIVYNAGSASLEKEAGHLADQIVVKEVGRSRRRIGFYVGFPDELFQGPTYYGGYIEFGWDHRGGFHIEADSFLRRALYPEAERIVAYVRARVASYLAERNRAAPENTPSAF